MLLAQKVKELEIYLRATYNESCQRAIMTETPATFPDPDMPTIYDSGIGHQRIYAEMTYLEKKYTDEAIHQKLRKKDVYE